MVENLLAFNFSKTRTICDAFDDAWTLLQGLGSDLTQAPKSLATQTILAKRIIEMADQGLRDIPALRDDALAFLQHSPPSDSRNLHSAIAWWRVLDPRTGVTREGAMEAGVRRGVS